MSNNPTSEWRDCDVHDHGYENHCLLCRIDVMDAHIKALQDIINTLEGEINKENNGLC